MPTPSPQQQNTEQLREAIDRGATGDKVDFPDPAAAPLGTDDEAAGRPVPGVAIERKPPQARRAIEAGSRKPSAGGRVMVLLVSAMIATAVALVAVLAI
ncbi:hypothetical protein [Dongia sp.]|uniref:hypothetical protein n=1 Tax=Dongia sp. TaxID=1977262 RepID=UPI00375348D5